MNDQATQPAQLIPITERAGRDAVSLRDLYAFLEVRKDFTDWAKTMFEYGFTTGSDYAEVYPEKGENPLGGRPPRNWVVTLDMAKELSMIQRTAKGKEARQYFIEVERRARAATRPALDLEALTPRALALAILQESDRADAAEQQLAIAAPKAEAFQQFIDAEG